MNLLPMETIHALRIAWEKGLSHRVAARTVGVNRHSVEKYFKMWRRDPAIVDPISRDELRGSVADGESPDLFCVVSPHLKQKLIEAAKQRKTSLNHLVGFLLDVIVEENLIPAIMEETGDDEVAIVMPVKRQCLCCGSAFFSAHRYNRLCRECSAASADGPGDAAVDYVSNAQAVVEAGFSSRGRMGGFIR